MRRKWNTLILTTMMVLGLVFISDQTVAAQQTNAYNVGYDYGRQDKRSNRSSDWKRYKDQYNRNTRKDFRQGYEDGFRDAGNSNWGGIWRPGTGGGNWGQGNGRTPPNWMVGTFRGYTPSNNTYTLITVSPDGYISIAAENGDGAARGYFSNGRVVFEWGEYRFRREGNGFRAVNQSNNNDRVFYQRVR